ncbi:UNVERIFIED_CONTAM: hypothetical protein Sradi_4630700 [Sesamum radiatum]|uniref:Uncharacterized protein n=2 Tax=Sesamum radiatum TaxID=300843 RepID=A0AAW2NE29_SESRA
MEDAHTAKKECRGEKRKDMKVKTPTKKPGTDSQGQKTPLPKGERHVHPTDLPITQALMAVEGKDLLTHPKSRKDGTPMTQRRYKTPPHPVRSGLKNSHNDALVITALLANYEVGRIFIVLESSADILFGDAYNQMRLGDTPMENVNTSLYSFAGEVVHPRGMISLPLTLGTGSTLRAFLIKFWVVDTPSAYNAIFWRPTLNTFQAIISTYHVKIKFPTTGSGGKVQGEPRGLPPRYSRLKNC